MSIAAGRGSSILRGAASNNAPLNKRDPGEVARAEFSLDHERPSTRFMVTIAGLGIVALSIGLVCFCFIHDQGAVAHLRTNTAPLRGMLRDDVPLTVDKRRVL